MKRIASLMMLFAVTVLGCQQMSGQTNQTPAANVEAGKWRVKLTPDEYDIMVNKGTEPPFKNAYWNNHQKGIYVSAATGDTLFSSADKFDSGTGWPSFTKPVSANKVAFIKDGSYGMERTEVVEKSTGLHLGHVFDDGPVDRGGKRYCMNSAALKFIKQ